ncbi:MAG: hypothetical protein IKH15_04275 [Bacteroidales bacterium]|nr:hypothetical protein [Bacteroidales bacterium]
MEKNWNIFSMSFMKVCPYKRHYNSTLSIWLSVDPMADKYPGLSPYTYCADNPVKLVDPDGRTFVVGDDNESRKDILSIVAEHHRHRISFGENGVVSVNLEGLSDEALEKDIGLSLINDMAGSDYKYYYETSDIALCCNSNGEKIAPALYLSQFRGVINASRNGVDSKNGHTQLPMEGYDGQVVIAKTGEFRYQGRDVRINIVFHELEENYLRTDKCMPYWGPKGVGAHETAADIEFQGWGSQGGWAIYTPNLQDVDYYKNGLRKSHYLY